MWSTLAKLLKTFKLSGKQTKAKLIRRNFAFEILSLLPEIASSKTATKTDLDWPRDETLLTHNNNLHVVFDCGI